MAVRVADSLKQQNDLKTFPVAYSEDIWIDKNKGEGEKDYADLQELYNEGALGGSGLPTPESKDKLLVSTENEETSELEWSQVDKGTVDGSAYVNLDVGSDLNTLITHGRFRTTTKRVDRIENVPVQVAGMLTVRLTGSVIYQTYNSIDNKMYTRTSEDAGENWSDWKDVSEGGDKPFKGTHDEWDALSDEEKAMFETVIFTDDYGESSSLHVEELWANPNPNVAFTAQTISIPNLSRYKLILFETRYHTTVGFIETKTIVNTPHSTLINTNFFSGTSRDIEIKSDSIVFGSGKFYPTYAAGTFNTDNNFCYPNKIYGIR